MFQDCTVPVWYLLTLWFGPVDLMPDVNCNSTTPLLLPLLLSRRFSPLKAHVILNKYKYFELEMGEYFLKKGKFFCSLGSTKIVELIFQYLTSLKILSSLKQLRKFFQNICRALTTRSQVASLCPLILKINLKSQHKDNNLSNIVAYSPGLAFLWYLADSDLLLC